MNFLMVGCGELVLVAFGQNTMTLFTRYSQLLGPGGPLKLSNYCGDCLLVRVRGGRHEQVPRLHHQGVAVHLVGRHLLHALLLRGQRLHHHLVAVRLHAVLHLQSALRRWWCRENKDKRDEEEIKEGLHVLACFSWCWCFYLKVKLW